ncbi:MAG: hypothetical protein FWE37_04470 [Spirochaetaceae bacterium]|nr:hypothetical protein [Spirochaetaceae bacterium]
MSTNTIKRLGLVLVTLTLLAFGACSNRSSRGGSGGNGGGSGNGSGSTTAPPITFALPASQDIIDAIDNLGADFVNVTAYTVNGAAVAAGDMALPTAPITVAVSYHFDSNVQAIANADAREAVVALFTSFNNVAVTVVGNDAGAAVLPPGTSFALPSQPAITSAVTNLGGANVVISAYTVDGAVAGSSANYNAQIVLTVNFDFPGPTTQVNLAAQAALEQLFTGAVTFIDVTVTALGRDSLVLGLGNMPQTSGPRPDINYSAMPDSAVHWVAGYPGGDGAWLARGTFAAQFMRYGGQVGTNYKFYIMMFTSSTTVREYEFTTGNWGNYNNVQPVTSRDFTWTPVSNAFTMIAGSEVTGITPADALAQISYLYLHVVQPTIAR